MAKTRETARARTKLRRSKRAPEHSNGVPAVAGGVVDLLARTAVTALSGVRDVGAEVGSVTITAIRGSVRAAGEIGADVGRLAAGATEGAIEAADRIAVAAGKAVGDLVRGTVEGVRGIMQSPPARRPALAKPSQPISRAASGRVQPLASSQRKPLAQRASRTTERARSRNGRSARTA